MLASVVVFFLAVGVSIRMVLKAESNQRKSGSTKDYEITSVRDWKQKGDRG
jgi:hypothetical protein